MTVVPGYTAGAALALALAAEACHPNAPPVPKPVPVPSATPYTAARPAPSELPAPPRCEPSADAATNHPCAVQTGVSLPTDGSLIPFGDESEGEITWKGKLDPDDRDDLILLFHGTAGNWGEILYSAYVGCGNGHYAPVFGPDYALELVPADADPAGHRRLRWVSRNDSQERPDTITTELRFDASGCYVPVAPPNGAP
jgi:hypothetical protein